jgi:hypothetical protein
MTWLTDLKRTNPALAADYALVGNQSGAPLRNMVKALSLFPSINSQEENIRLAAAKRVLKSQGHKS